MKGLNLLNRVYPTVPTFARSGAATVLKCPLTGPTSATAVDGACRTKTVTLLPPRNGATFATIHVETSLVEGGGAVTGDIDAIVMRQLAGTRLWAWHVVGTTAVNFFRTTLPATWSDPAIMEWEHVGDLTATIANSYLEGWNVSDTEAVFTLPVNDGAGLKYRIYNLVLAAGTLTCTRSQIGEADLMLGVAGANYVPTPFAFWRTATGALLVGDYGAADAVTSVYRSEDNGLTWTECPHDGATLGFTPSAGGVSHTHGFGYHAETGLLLMGRGDYPNGGFWYSDDDGATWTLLTNDTTVAGIGGLWEMGPAMCDYGNATKIVVGSHQDRGVMLLDVTTGAWSQLGEPGSPIDAMRRHAQSLSITKYGNLFYVDEMNQVENGAGYNHKALLVTSDFVDTAAIYQCPTSAGAAAGEQNRLYYLGLGPDGKMQFRLYGSAGGYLLTPVRPAYRTGRTVGPAQVACISDGYFASGGSSWITGGGGQVGPTRVAGGGRFGDHITFTRPAGNTAINCASSGGTSVTAKVRGTQPDMVEGNLYTFRFSIKTPNAATRRDWTITLERWNDTTDGWTALAAGNCPRQSFPVAVPTLATAAWKDFEFQEVVCPSATDGHPCVRLNVRWDANAAPAEELEIDISAVEIIDVTAGPADVYGSNAAGNKAADTETVTLVAQDAWTSVLVFQPELPCNLMGGATAVSLFTLTVDADNYATVQWIPKSAANGVDGVFRISSVTAGGAAVTTDSSELFFNRHQTIMIAIRSDGTLSVAAGNAAIEHITGTALAQLASVALTRQLGSITQAGLMPHTILHERHVPRLLTDGQVAGLFDAIGRGVTYRQMAGVAEE